jgi:hypothetical protein
MGCCASYGIATVEGGFAPAFATAADLAMKEGAAA